MALKLSDLPPAARERALRAAGEPGPRPAERRKASRAGTGPGEPCAGSCSGCGGTFDRYTRWERHHDAGCAGRWVIDLDRSSPDEPVPGFSSGEQAGNLRPDSSRDGETHVP